MIAVPVQDIPQDFEEVRDTRDLAPILQSVIDHCQEHSCSVRKNLGLMMLPSSKTGLEESESEDDEKLEDLSFLDPIEVELGLVNVDYIDLVKIN